MKLPYNPSIGEIAVRKHMLLFRRVSYNRFRWWRWVDSYPKMNLRSPLLERIKNGDFDNFVYFVQAIYCEHKLNKLWIECNEDVIKYNELSIKLNLRRQKLLEDYWKVDEKNYKDLLKSLSKHFKIELEVLMEFSNTFDGTPEELYHYIDKNTMKFKNKLIKFIDGI